MLGPKRRRGSPGCDFMADPAGRAEGGDRPVGGRARRRDRGADLVDARPARRGFESGFRPSLAEAEAWAERETLGLIRKFPMQIDQFTRVVLASALATKVKWEAPFEVVPAAEHCGVASPWKGAVSRFLWDGLGALSAPRAMIARTDGGRCGRGPLRGGSGGSDRGLGVGRARSCAIGPPCSPARMRSPRRCAGSGGRVRARCMTCRSARGTRGRSLRREVPVFDAKEPRIERVAGAALPAWRVRAANLDLTPDPLSLGQASCTLRPCVA